MNFNRKLAILTLAVMLFTLTACQNDDKIEAQRTTDNIIHVVTTLFPQYDFARTLGNEDVDVSLLLPPGVESHSFEPTPQDVLAILNSDIFIYTSLEMEPWVSEVLKNVDETKTTVIDASVGIDMIASDHEHEDDHDLVEEHDEDHSEDAVDPHYWLDPNNAIHMVKTISEALIQKLPSQETQIKARQNTLINALENLDADIIRAFENTDSKTILTGGHFAFGYFAHRYGLESQSPYAGFSPDAEPTPQRIAALMKTIKETKAKAIYYEELIDPRVAKIISEETGVKMLLLHGAHNLSKQEIEEGVTYIEIMEGNLERLKEGLGYHESTN